MKKKKTISIVSPTFNEEGNIQQLYNRVISEIDKTKYDYEFIVIDNASTDKTPEILRKLASLNKKFKVIFNETNFGHIRSPYHALLQTSGDAVVFLASDLQDPPELIHQYLEAWEHGAKVVFAIKKTSDEPIVIRTLRKLYYRMISNISESRTVQNATGAGLFDKSVIETLRTLSEPVPYFRGLLPELGFEIKTLEFHQPLRNNGKTKNNLFTLIDMAILGVTTQSKAPMRLISIFGALIGMISFFIAFIYVGLKLVIWQSADFGITPIIFGVFFLGAIQIFFIGIIGEYLVSIQTRIRNLPHVIERERLNF